MTSEVGPRAGMVNFSGKGSTTGRVCLESDLVNLFYYTDLNVSQGVRQTRSDAKLVTIQ